MSGIIILGIGIGFIALSVLLSIVAVIYQSTTGKKIREELFREYD